MIVGLVIWFNLDVILLPKNSITVVVTDQNGNAIEELKLNLYADTQSYDIEYSDISDYTILSAVPGDYTVI